jgi:peptidoglycan/LPS O-acetylase OafA/YrhL
MTTTVGGGPSPIDVGPGSGDGGANRGRPLTRVLRFLEPHGGGRFAALDGCRAVAALGVVVYHVAGWANLTSADTVTSRFLNNLGNFGVATFFLLSGFLLYRGFVMTWFRDELPPDPIVYLRHRLLRILPAYWLALTAFIALGLVKAQNAGGDYYVTLYALLQNYRPSYGFAGLTVAWTLCIEVSFYIALPFLAAFIRFIGRNAHTLRMKLEAQLVGLATLYVFTLIYRGVLAGPWQYDKVGHPNAIVHLFLPNYFDWFSMGMLLAVCVCWRDMGRRLPKIVQRFADTGWLCWLCAAACYFVLMMSRQAATTSTSVVVGVGPETTSEMYTRFFLNGFAGFFFLLPIILGLKPRMLVKRSLSWIVPMYLGTISYGIYLWHKLWLDYLKPDAKSTTHISFWVMLAMVLGLTFVTASVSYYALERPLMKFKDPRRLRSRAKSTIAA